MVTNKSGEAPVAVRGDKISRAGRGALGLARMFSRDPLETALFVVLMAGLVWTPFWLGGNRVLPWGVNAVYFGLALLAYEVSLLWRGTGHAVGAKELVLPVALFVGVCLWCVFQMSIWSPAGVQHPVWATASDALGRALNGSISVDPDLSALAFMRLLTGASVFWLSLQLCRDSERAHWLLNGVGIAIAAYSAWGVVSLVFFSNAIFWFGAPDIGPWLRSTFVNRNSFATYAGLGLVALVAVFLRLYRREGLDFSGSWKLGVVQFLEVSGRRGWIVMSACLVVLVALLLSGSRGGIMASGFGLFVLLMLAFRTRRRHASERVEAVVFIGAGIAACFLFFGDLFVGRISVFGVFDVNRWSVYMISIQSILDAPFLGFGYGTFMSIFPLYRDRSISVLGAWEDAHNSYIEVFQGLGLIGGSMLVACVGYVVYLCFRGALRRQRSSAPCCVAVAASCLVGAHALVDFSLQIQAVTLTWLALLGAGAAQSISSRRTVGD